MKAHIFFSEGSSINWPMHCSDCGELINRVDANSRCVPRARTDAETPAAAPAPGTGTNQERVKRVYDATEAAFSEALRVEFPEATDGGVDPRLQNLFDVTLERVIRDYVDMNCHPPDGFAEHPGIRFPQWLKDLGFEDRSYRNDLAARAERKLTPELDLICWVAEEDPGQREIPNEQKQFYIHIAKTDDDEELELVYDGDSPKEAADAIERRIASVAAPAKESKPQ